MERPAFVLQVRPEPGVPDVIRSLRSWLKQGLRAHGLRCVSIEEVNVSKPRRIGIPNADSIDDIWQRRAMSNAIVAVREVINGGVIPPAAPLNRLTDVELGWLVAAGLFSWIRTRAEQATAEGWDMEQTLRATGQPFEPWDEGAVVGALPDIGKIQGIDWERSIGAWPKEMIVRFLLAALALVRHAMIARDAGGGIATNRKSVEEMQRVASAEAGGSLTAPGELDLPF
jgi:hypothetical protein